ncbi:hypothetical protein PQX77_015971 [Marasmius sp. AFHP31]|nr:hypothetical protein PQX77_015971 [Marasmius sp. AFHP31]
MHIPNVTKTTPTAIEPSFHTICFSVNAEFPYQSICPAKSFDDPHLHAWLKTHAAIEKGILTAEGEGYIYVFRIDGVDFSDVTDRDLSHTVAYKVGRTVNPEARKRQWHRQCPSQTHEWYEVVPVKYCHDVERLVHAALEEICVLRPRKVCSDCQCEHHEIFLMPDTPHIVEEHIIPITEESVCLAQMARRKCSVVDV